MKLDAIVRKSLPNRKLNAALVKVVQYKTGRDKEGFAVAMARTYSTHEVNVLRRVIPAKDRSKYVSAVRFIDKRLNVHVACSCPDFKFRWETALAHAGAAVIHYSNGEPPTETNGEMRPGACKHILALRELIKKKHGI